MCKCSRFYFEENFSVRFSSYVVAKFNKFRFSVILRFYCVRFSNFGGLHLLTTAYVQKESIEHSV